MVVIPAIVIIIIQLFMASLVDINQMVMIVMRVVIVIIADEVIMTIPSSLVSIVTIVVCSQ